MIFSYTFTILLGLLSILILPVQPQQQQDQIPMSNDPSEQSYRRERPDGMSKSLNVFKQPLAFFSASPMTGFMRNGYCEVPVSDFGNHSVAAEVTEEFLDFTAKQGNDLRAIGGMKGGCKWCLCASRWLEAFEAQGREKEGSKIVPKIFLNATNQKALGTIDLADLKKFAVDKEEGSS